MSYLSHKTHKEYPLNQPCKVYTTKTMKNGHDKYDDDDSSSSSDNKDIDKAVLNLVELLSKKDRSKIEETLARLRRELLLVDAPPAEEVVVVTKAPHRGGGGASSQRLSVISSAEESACDISVMDVRATQSSIAIYITEASLYRQEADCIEQVLQRLAQAKLSYQEEWQHHVVKPVQESQQKLLESAKAADEIAQQKLNEFLRLRKIANKGVASLMLQDERSYTEEFRLALRGPGLDAARQLGIRMEELQAVIKIERDDDGNIIKEGKKCYNHQPIPTNLQPTSPDYLQWLRSQGQTILETEFQSVTNEIAQACNATAVLAPLKGYARTVQKAQEEYNGDYSRILDCVRGMIIFQDLPNCAKAIDMLAEFQNQGRLTILRAKDRLSLFYNAAVDTGGYRDCLFNLSFPGASDNNKYNDSQSKYPIVCELQIQLQNFLALKNEKHEHYEAARNIHMFNRAFCRRRFFWTPNASEEEVTALLEDIEHGVLREIDLDYSLGLWSFEAQQRLADSLKKNERAVMTLSLRSCKCGDDFIRMFIPQKQQNDDDGMPSLPTLKNHGTHLGVESSLQILRLGSLLHEGTAGRISQQGVETLLKVVGTSIRILDLEGCLDLEGKENCGDDVVEAIVHLLQVEERNDDDDTPTRLLLQLKEINLKSTGLTKNGLEKLIRLQQDGKIPSRCCFVSDVDL